ncbi:MAG TPA: phosphoribosylformylglycinamidine synthase subunit PurS [Nitrospirales bacterium]|nr:phosphoribosylformylglycinamidine synthase subunit PurS [Nitrospirales bacterium]
MAKAILATTLAVTSSLYSPNAWRVFCEIMKAKIYITLKNGILDPQGRAIQQSLQTLGFDTVGEVRIGKFIEVDLCETDRTSAGNSIKEMCEKLLANTVIEDYQYEIIEA